MQRYASLRRGLVGAWCPSVSGPFGYRLPDISGYGNHGTLTNMDPGSDWVVSGGKGALDFDGSNDWVDVKNPAFFTSLKSLSFCMWAKANANPAQYDSFGACSTTSDAWNAGWGFYFASSSVVRFFVNVWNVSFASSVSSTFTNVNHICGLWDGSLAKVFINGIEGTPSGTVSSFNASNVYGLTIGKITTVSELYNFNGWLDDIRIYNRALSEQEIRLLASERGIGLKPERQRNRYLVPTPSRNRSSRFLGFPS